MKIYDAIDVLVDVSRAKTHSGIPLLPANVREAIDLVVSGFNQAGLEGGDKVKLLIVKEDE